MPNQGYLTEVLIKCGRPAISSPIYTIAPATSLSEIIKVM